MKLCASHCKSITVALSLLSLSTACGAEAIQPLTQIMSPQITQRTLANGIRVVVKTEPGIPLVAIDTFVRVSTDDESTRDAGIASFVARTLLASTASDTPEHMLSDINDLGGSVSVTHEIDYIELNALTVKDKFTNAMFLVSDVMRNADFDEASVERSRSDMLSELDQSDSDVFTTGYNTLKQSLYGDTGPAVSVVGTRASIKRIRQADLLQFYHRIFVPTNITIVVDGDISADDAVSKVESYFGDMRGGFKHPVAEHSVREHAPDVLPVRSEVPNLAEVGVMVGYEAAPSTSEDYPAVLVADTLLGGMKSSLMFVNIREKEGLAYSLGSFYNARHDSGEVVGYALAAPTHTDHTTQSTVPSVPMLKKLIIEQFNSLKTAPQQASDVARAEHYLIGTYLVKHERIEDRASLLGVATINSVYGADFDTHFADYINKVTPADIERVARKYFTTPSISIVEPATRTPALHLE